MIIIFYLPVLITLGYLSYVDIKTREVPPMVVLSLFIYSFLYLFFLNRESILPNLIFGAVLFIVLLILSVFTGESIGGGDIKLATVIAFFLGRTNFTLFVLPLACLMFLTLIWALITRKGLNYEVPFVPYLFLSFLGVLFWI